MHLCIVCRVNGVLSEKPHCSACEAIRATVAERLTGAIQNYENRFCVEFNRTDGVFSDPTDNPYFNEGSSVFPAENLTAEGSVITDKEPTTLLHTDAIIGLVDDMSDIPAPAGPIRDTLRVPYSR